MGIKKQRSGILNVYRRGFTIVELLIVIVVIAILATIVIVSYNGIKGRAQETTLKTDLSQNGKSISITKTRTGMYPENQLDAALQATSGNNLEYFVSADRRSYCLEASGYGKTFAISNTTNSPILGYCNGFLAVEGAAPPQPTASIFIGNGTNGFSEGTNGSAVVGEPMGMAMDSSGNIYLADSYNHRIRKITPAGVTSTLAGNGSYGGGSGYVNATGTSARFNHPKDVAVDASGNVYVADSGNHAIRRITPAGVVTTFAGATTATSGTTNATGTSARFNSPEGITITSSGVLYVADTGNNRIRMITSAQVVTTPAGSSSGWVDATGTSARFNQPVGIAVTSAGDVYIADKNNHSIRKMTSGGIVTTVAGTTTYGYENGTGSNAEFYLPRGIAIDNNGDILVADRDNDALRKVTPAGVVTTVLEGDSGTWPNAVLVAPSGIIYVSTGSHYVFTVQ